jgi:hypothetical protein
MQLSAVAVVSDPVITKSEACAEICVSGLHHMIDSYTESSRPRKVDGGGTGRLGSGSVW